MLPSAERRRPHHPRFGTRRRWRHRLPPACRRRVRCPAVAAAVLVAAKVWHFWIAVFQVIPFLLIVLVLGWLYVTKVLARKHPRQ